MNIKSFFSIFLLLGHIGLLAQTTGIIRGNLKDKNTQETIIGGTVIIEQRILMVIIGFLYSLARIMLRLSILDILL